jgi:DNA-binding MarR family transcriptional regulator
MARTWLSARATEALRLLSVCPNMPADVLSVLRGVGPSAATEQLLRRLESVGLVQARRVALSPLLGSRRLKLWSLTARGAASVMAKRGVDKPDKVICGRARQIQSAGALIANYWLLAASVSYAGARVRVVGWEYPWLRHARVARDGRTSHVRLPAGARLQGLAPAEGQVDRSILLLPDLGTAPVQSYAVALRKLFTLCAGSTDDHLVVVATLDRPGSTTRASAWEKLVRRAATRAGHSVPVRVLTWSQVASTAPGISRLVAYARSSAGIARRTQADVAFGLISRHPLLTREQLALLLGVDNARAGRLLRQLDKRGWVRRISSDEVQRADVDPALVRSLHLVELTAVGRRIAASRLLLPSSSATRHHGLLAVRGRGRRLVHLSHTIGANAVFVALADAARAVRQRGGDDVLEEWRSAAACARGRFRPDGYGCYRRGGVRHGFFLEFDRSTERPREYAAKLRAYYRYRASRAAGDYAGFPVMLVVTTSKRAEATIAEQARIAAYLREGRRLEVLIATTERIAAAGILGPIWRTSDHTARAEQGKFICWPPK